MSATTQATTTAPLRSLSFLVAPLGELSADGQLRELIEERRQSKGADVDLWYLGPDLVEELALGNAQEEAVLAGDPAVITWLWLRFGGRPGTFRLSPTLLHERTGGLPPKAPAAAVEGKR
jgi:hypothetical protein